ncbi:MAG: TnpV protein [Clostridia bacterium]|nr:TnpV protein [Clostridia bacterium]
MLMKKEKEELIMMKIEYTEKGDYKIPNITMKMEEIPTGKYARARYRYLKEHQKAELTIMRIEGKLNEHLTEIQETATKRVEQIVQEMAKQENITEELKAQDQMKWVQLMNNLKMTAEEIVYREIIYA